MDAKDFMENFEKNLRQYDEFLKNHDLADKMREWAADAFLNTKDDISLAARYAAHCKRAFPHDLERVSEFWEAARTGMIDDKLNAEAVKLEEESSFFTMRQNFTSALMPFIYTLGAKTQAERGILPAQDPELNAFLCGLMRP